MKNMAIKWFWPQVSCVSCSLPGAVRDIVYADGAAGYGPKQTVCRMGRVPRESENMETEWE